MNTMHFGEKYRQAVLEGVPAAELYGELHEP